MADQTGDRLYGAVHQADNTRWDPRLFTDFDDALRRERRAL